MIRDESQSIYLILSSLILIIICSAAQIMAEYNLINTAPHCYKLGFCADYGYPGGNNSIHPNSEERTQHLFHNMARNFPQKFVNSKFGKYIYGISGNYTYINDKCYDKNKEINIQYPMWYNLDLNEMARFKQYDYNNCINPPLFEHDTCSSNCYLFNNDCSFINRCLSFLNDNISCLYQPKLESIWRANIGYQDSIDCLPIFDENIYFQGVGFWPKMKNVAINYIKNREIQIKPFPYLIPMGTHFDERIKVNINDLNKDGKHLVFMVEFFGNNKVEIAYILYNGNAHILSKLFDDNNNNNNNHSIYILYSYISRECEPYSFLIKTINNNEWIRLPQNNNYYFGTTFIEWDSWKPQYECHENHYWFNNKTNKWIVNGAPNIDENIIEYKQSQCIGCSKVNILRNIEYSLMYNNNNNNDTENIIYSIEIPITIQIDYEYLNKSDILQIDMNENDIIQLITDIMSNFFFNKTNIKFDINPIVFSININDNQLYIELNIMIENNELIDIFLEYIKDGSFDNDLLSELQILYENDLLIRKIETVLIESIDTKTTSLISVSSLLLSSSSSSGEIEEDKISNFFASYLVLIVIGVIILILLIICIVIIYIIKTQKDDTISPHTKIPTANPNTPSINFIESNNIFHTKHQSEFQLAVNKHLEKTKSVKNKRKNMHQIQNSDTVNITDDDEEDEEDEEEEEYERNENKRKYISKIQENNNGSSSNKDESNEEEDSLSINTSTEMIEEEDGKQLTLDGIDENEEEEEEDKNISFWLCDVCTFNNNDGNIKCKMCLTLKSNEKIGNQQQQQQQRSIPKFKPRIKPLPPPRKPKSPKQPTKI